MKSSPHLLGLAAVGAVCLAGCEKPAPPPAAAPANTVAPAPAANDAADAKAFLEGLYAHYRSSKDNHFEPFGANEKDVFDADTVALLDQDAKAMKGEVGVLDGDWLCACQDFESIVATINVKQASPTAATATADFSDVGMPGQGRRHADFDLSKTGGVWRVHDVTVQGDEGSLRAMLQGEIKSLAKGGKANNPDEAP
jgi:hypothetical protein